MSTFELPELQVEVDFDGNPTATFADVRETHEDVVSSWRLSSTSTLEDVRGLNDGVILGTPTLVTGPFPFDADQALAFDGVSDSAYVPSDSSLTTKNPFAADGLVSFPAFPAATRDVVGIRGSWLLQINSAGQLLFVVKDDTSLVTVTSNTVLDTDTFYYVSLVYDGAEAKLYINGLLDNSAAYSSGMELGGQPLRFAATPCTTAPTYQSVQTNSGSGTTISVSKPASVAVGDLLILHAGAHSSASNIDSIDPPDSTWTPLVFESIASVTKAGLWAKIADGTEAATLTMAITGGTNNWNVAAIRVTGQDTVEWLANLVYHAPFASVSNKTTGAHIANMANTLRMDFVYSRGATLTTFSSGTERYDFSGGNVLAMASQVPSESSLAQTVTSGVSNGAAFTLHIAGTGLTELEVTLKDWTYWSDDLTDDEVGLFNASIDAGTGTWTDITGDVRDCVSTTARRQEQLDAMAAGGANLVLRDEAHDYDPTNTESPHSPNVVADRRIRIRGTHLSTTYPIATLYAEDWMPRYLGGGYQELDLAAVDGFDFLSRARVDGELDIAFSGTQIDRLADKANWPLDLRAIDAGQYVMVASTLSNAFALSEMRTIADSELGIVFIDRDGVLTYHDAAHRGSSARSATSQATFFDNPELGDLVYRFQGLEPAQTKDKLVNDWTVSPDDSVFGAAAQRVIDYASHLRHGNRASSRSTRLSSNADALSQARALLNRTSVERTRFDKVVCTPTNDDAIAACLDLRISDRVTLSVGGQEHECFVESKETSSPPGIVWTWTFRLSPVGSGNYASMIVRDGPVSYYPMNEAA